MPGAGLLVSLYWAGFFKTEACVVRPPFGQKPGLVRPSQVRGGSQGRWPSRHVGCASVMRAVTASLTTARNKGPA